jgi:hypothetical protein
MRSTFISLVDRVRLVGSLLTPLAAACLHAGPAAAW